MHRYRPFISPTTLVQTWLLPAGACDEQREWSYEPGECYRYTHFFTGQNELSQNLCAKNFGICSGIILYIKSTHFRMFVSMFALLLLWSLRWPAINKDILGVSEKVPCYENLVCIITSLFFLQTWVNLISTTFNVACYMKLSL